MQLHEISRPVSELKGVGHKRAKQLAWRGIESVADLLYYYPRNWEDRSQIIPLGTLLKRTKSTLPGASSFLAVTKVNVLAHEWIGYGSKKTLKVKIQDLYDQTIGFLVCFGRNFLVNKLLVGNSFLLAGSFQLKFQELQSTNFECSDPSNTDSFFQILPIYSLTQNLTQNFFRTVIKEALTLYESYIDDDLEPLLQQQHQLLPLFQALKAIHTPRSSEELQQGLRSLKFREFYHLHHHSLVAKKKREKIALLAWELKKEWQEKFEKALPFSLSPSQKKVIEEINHDLCKPFPMERLLQGDVGCGKTLVAIEAALLAIANRKQVALMVPTELLAHQHAHKIEHWLTPLGISIALLTGKYQGESKALLLAALKKGEIQLIIGTHALFYSSVEFHDLGLIIIDEQHKFGVRQRDQLRQKGIHPHLLLLSATPIPRTLAQTLYGHLSISTIEEIPSGRKPIRTHLCVEEKEDSVYQRVHQELQRGNQGYFIYPQIGSSDEKKREKELKEYLKEGVLLDEEDFHAPLKIKTAQEGFEKLSKSYFKDYRCALIHSEIPDPEKEKIMQSFNTGKIDLLFSTTVVEVGIDNPNATIMVIESAQHFGLSTLHQLRGRIGRGEKQSYCFCIYHPTLSELAKQRLRTLLQERDGFKISKMDLQIRGPGEIFGFRQSGILRLRLADLENDQEIEKEALFAANQTLKNEY